MTDKRVRTSLHVGKSYRILCVDDNVLTTDLLSVVLQQQGYEVLTSSDPIMAIKVLQQEAFELALLDYEMPQMNGGELAAVVKCGGLSTKVILFSGSPRIPQRDLAFVDRFVQKSEGVETLLEAIESLLCITNRALANVPQQ